MNVLPQLPPGLNETVTTVPRLVPASQLATEQFNAVMQAGTPPGAGLDATTSSTAIPDVASAPPPGPLSLGTKILDGLQNSSNDLSGRWQSISERLDQTSATPNVTELLQVQTQLLQVSIHYELVGKAISKSTQNIDTMVRMQ